MNPAYINIYIYSFARIHRWIWDGNEMHKRNLLLCFFEKCD